MNAPIPAQGKPVWDLPIRLFHWSLAVLVLLQFGTAKFGWLDMQWHFRFGYAVLALLLFRLLWGLAGSDNLRFGALMAGPHKLLTYFREWRQTPVSQLAGHNPFGGWAALLILFVLLAQAITGLAAADDIEWFGPLHDRLPEIWVERANWLHHRLEPVILVLIAMHVLAVLQYLAYKRENLTASMIHGRRALEVTPPRLAGNRRAVLLFAFSVLVVSVLIWWWS